MFRPSSLLNTLLRKRKSNMLIIPSTGNTEFQRLGCLNWPLDFPYSPSVGFRISHDSDNIYLWYSVDEMTTRAEEGTPGEFVYKDSCVEFFIQPRLDDPHYYNFEWNAIGTLYLAYRTGRADAELAPKEVLSLVKAESSIGREPFAERVEGPWSLKITIPRQALWHSDIQSFDGLKARANFYKCGDGLKVPHYITWAPIDTPRPDYHRPEFFAPIEFSL